MSHLSTQRPPRQSEVLYKTGPTTAPKKREYQTQVGAAPIPKRPQNGTSRDPTSLPTTQRVRGWLTHYSFDFSEKVTRIPVGQWENQFPPHAEDSHPPLPLKSEHPAARFLQPLGEGGRGLSRTPRGRLLWRRRVHGLLGVWGVFAALRPEQTPDTSR